MKRSIFAKSANSVWIFLFALVAFSLGQPVFSQDTHLYRYSAAMNVWTIMAIDLPGGLVETFSYDGSIVARKYDQELLRYDRTSNSWLSMSLTAPAGTVQVTSSGHFLGETELLVARTSDGQLYWSSGNEWLAIPTRCPAGTTDFLIWNGVIAIVTQIHFETLSGENWGEVLSFVDSVAYCVPYMETLYFLGTDGQIRYLDKADNMVKSSNIPNAFGAEAILCFDGSLVIRK